MQLTHKNSRDVIESIVSPCAKDWSSFIKFSRFILDINLIKFSFSQFKFGFFNWYLLLKVAIHNSKCRSKDE